MWHFLRQAAFDVRERIESRFCDPEFHALLHCVYWSDVEAHIAEIGDISRRSHLPVIFLIHPLFENEPFARYRLLDLHHELAKLATTNGLIPLDGLDCFRGHSPDELRLHRQVVDPWHPNSAGHEILGRCVADTIARPQ